jgi:hypothetical protein
VWGLKGATDVDGEDADGNRLNVNRTVTSRAELRESHEVFLSMQEAIDTLHHRGRIIDVFKIDCEGCEWTTFQDWISSSSDVDIRQILVETHNNPMPAALDFFTSLQNANYVTFHKEPNTQYADGNCQEYAFLKLDPQFFK